MKKIISPLVLLSALAACSDGPTGPPEASSIEIVVGGAPVAEQTLAVGETKQLTASVQGPGGATEWNVSWRSTAPNVAGVDASGLLTGVSQGEALVIASVDRVADTIRVTVTPPPVTEATCGPQHTTLTLQVGQVHQVQANQAGLLCLAGGSGAEFVLIPFNAGTTGTMPVEVLGGNVRSPALPLFPSIERTGGPVLGAAQAREAGRDDWQFHMRLRQTEKELLRTRRTPGGSGPLLSVSTASVPSVGDVIRLNASVTACTDTDFRDARVEAVSNRAIIAADVGNPTGGFTRTDYQQFAAEFDASVWPVMTENFGSPSDVDQNARVIIFFTKAVNDMTEPGSGSYVGGFYHPRDLLPRTGSGSCAGSNAGEVLYQLVPDPQRASENDETFLETASVRRRTVAVIAHELQHLVNASRRYLELNAPLETVWLNEGLSHIAEELLFYRQAGLAPHGNVDLQTLRSSQQVLDAVNRHQISNIGRFISFLENPAQLNLSDGNDLVTRGASWAFLRYAADRKAPVSQQQQIWSSLVSSHDVGIANVTRVLGSPAFDWIQDWTVAVLVDDTGLPVEQRFLQPSWNFRSVVPALMQNETWPLLTRTLANDQTISLDLRPGGTSYLRLAVASGATGGIRVTSNRIAPPDRLRLSIVRTR